MPVYMHAEVHARPVEPPPPPPLLIALASCLGVQQPHCQYSHIPSHTPHRVCQHLASQQILRLAAIRI